MLRRWGIQNRLRHLLYLLFAALAYARLGSESEVKAAVLFSNLFSFTNFQNGSDPRPRLVLYTNGLFYGTTSGGGTYDQGTVFVATPGGLVTNLIVFDGTNGGGHYGNGEMVSVNSNAD